MNQAPVVIVGGGISGLAAGVALAGRGVRVIVLEQKPQAGGRAYSFRDAETGDVIDNGQHLLIAGYARTLHFLETIGASQKVLVQERPSLLFHHPVRGFQRLQFPRLPSPLHLAGGIVGSGLFTFAEKVSILRAANDIRSFNAATAERLAGLTVRHWLELRKQPAETQQSFWDPLSVSIMNERSERASAATLLRSLHRAFFGSWRNAAAVIPRVGLSELFVEDAIRYIVARGGEVQCGADVAEVVYDGSSVKGVRLKGGDIVDASATILAVPWNRLDGMLPQSLRDAIGTGRFNGFGHSPIVSIHLWFDKDFMPDEFIGLIGKDVQWLFNRRLVMKEEGTGGHISAVISAAHEHVGMTNEELILLTLKDTSSVYPGCPSVATHAVVIREKRATFSSSPENEPMRPDQRTRVPGLFLAGDWTRTGLPATIEGATISGERCAELAIEFMQGRFHPSP